MGKVYKERFGYNSGRWLVVCTSQARMENIKAQAEKVLGKGAANFYFTILERAQPDAVLNASIWLRGAANSTEPLVRTIQGNT